MSHDENQAMKRQAVELAEQAIRAGRTMAEQNPDIAESVLANVASIKAVAAGLSVDIDENDKLVATYAELMALIENLDVDAIKALKAEEVANRFNINDKIAVTTARVQAIRDELERRDSRILDPQAVARRILAGESVLPQPRAELEEERDILAKEGLRGLRQELNDLDEDARHLPDAFQPVSLAAYNLVPLMLKRAQHDLTGAYADSYALGWSLRAEGLKGLATQLGWHLAAMTVDGVFEFCGRFEASEPAAALIRAIVPAMEAAGHNQILRTWAPHPHLRINVVPMLPRAA